ncbi:MAG TPA: methyltransferase domain-containing protein [Pirellulales bacterium]|nr:methyltransferase domain-containing protein [Pirellulales bacterium]
MSWDAEQYLKFSDERGRPAADLLAQVPTTEPRLVVDLGCGTGRLAKALAERWPEARVIGVDNSPEMLAEARRQKIAGRLEFFKADFAEWSWGEPVDLVVSNAALHWAGQHERLLAKIVAMLAPAGSLAVQMPNNLRAPSHEAIFAVAAEPLFAAKLAGLGLHRESVRPLAWYAELLGDLGLAVNAWETTYLHVLSGENPVLEWLRGTALRPLLSVLDKQEAIEFQRQLAERLREAYPSRAGVTLFPMSRIFFVATRRRT